VFIVIMVIFENLNFTVYMYSSVATQLR